ncbi:MAG: hypothetical protein MUF62_08720 [Chitinophagaceae bacterium]|jgi:hypothetical protein|nr:hypothetical protein [Chitinophagaceae bacterium]
MMQSFASTTAASETSFNPWQYPQEMAELQTLFTRLLPYKSNVKADMVISFLRRHALRMVWVRQNIPLAKAIVNSRDDTAAVQQLFETHKENEAFCKDLEAYIELWLP